MHWSEHKLRSQSLTSFNTVVCSMNACAAITRLCV